MTVRRAALGALAAFTLGLLTGCAGAQDHVLSFEKGEYQARVHNLRVDVVGARYAERQLTVECAIINAGEAPVTLDREGVLLDDDGLEIPPQVTTGLPTEVVIPAGSSMVIRFDFAVGGLEPRIRTLGLWAIRSQSAALPPLRVEVPGVQQQSS